MTESERRNPERVATPVEVANAKLNFREGDDPKMELAVLDEIVRQTEERRVALMATTTEGNPADSASAPDTAPQTTPQQESTSEEPLTPKQIKAALMILKTGSRAEANRELAPTLDWQRAQEALREQPEALRTVLKAKAGGHEPTIYFADGEGFDIGTRAKETPLSTRNCVYDAAAEELEKKRNPGVKFNGNAVDQARAMGWGLMRASQGDHIARITESYYENSWSWYDTDEDTRSTGSALRGNRAGYALLVVQYAAYNHYNRGGWHGSLRVLYKKA